MQESWLPLPSRSRGGTRESRVPAVRVAAALWLVAVGAPRVCSAPGLLPPQTQPSGGAGPELVRQGESLPHRRGVPGSRGSRQRWRSPSPPRGAQRNHPDCAPLSPGQGSRLGSGNGELIDQGSIKLTGPELGFELGVTREERPPPA
ncbi:unnamed protein product [Lepidochelys kempii]